MMRPILLAFVTLSLSSGTASAQLLAPAGTCPGIMSFEVTGATAESRIAYVYAFNTGSYVIPPLMPCGGTTLGLDNTATLLTIEESDLFGTALFTTNVPPIACGNVYLQAVDAMPCTTSNVILIL